MELTPTQQEQKEVTDSVNNALHIFADAEMEFESALQFLQIALQTLHRKEEGTKNSQLYWGMAPILILQNLLKKDVNLDISNFLTDPLSVFFTGQEPHSICIYGSSLLRYAYNIQLNTSELEILSDFIQKLCKENGGFSSTETGEIDTRTTYAVLTTIYLNNLQSKFTNFLPKTVEFLLDKMQIFGFTGQERHGEAHASFTYCALAGLELLKRMGFSHEITQKQTRRLVKFLVFRQQETGGFNGRTNKHEDGCYNFWVGASLCLLGKDYLVNLELFNTWVRCCNQDFETGGFRDKPEISSDRFHNCYVLTGWCLLNKRCGIDPAVPIFKE